MERIDGILNVESELNGEMGSESTQNINGYISEQEVLFGELSEGSGLGGELSGDSSLNGALSVPGIPVVTNDYEILINKPRIESRVLIGNKTFEDLGLSSIDADDLIEILTN